MLKQAKSPPDAAQQKLRDNKKTWNTSVSAFINDLIHYKKLMNGHPSKFNMEKGNIKDPIPADPATIIGSLANDFSEIAQAATKLTAEQLAYSQNRRKKQSPNMKQMNLPLGQTPATPAAPVTPSSPAPSSTPDLSQQLSMPAVASAQYDLMVYGSNPISRFFTRLLTPTMGWSEAARIRKYRMTLLDACVKTFKDMEKLQLEIIKSSSQSINNSNKILHAAWNDWNIINRGFNIYNKNAPLLTSTDIGGEIPPSKDRLEQKAKDDLIDDGPKDPNAPMAGEYDHEPKDQTLVEPKTLGENAFEVISLAKFFKNDYFAALKQNKTNAIPQESIKILNELFQSLILKQDIDKQLVIANQIIQGYKTLVAQLNKAHGLAANSLSEIMAVINKRVAEKVKADLDALKKPNAAPINKSAEALEATAQKFLKKWIGKTRHNLWSNNTSVLRLDIFKMSQQVRANLNGIMDLIEKGMDVEKIGELIAKINRQMTDLRGIMRALNFANPEQKGKKPLENLM